MEVIRLVNNLRPDHRTVSDFRKKNKAAIKRMAIDFRKFLKNSDYITEKSLSADGTKIRAYASRDTLSVKLTEKKPEKAKKEIERYFAQPEAEDEAENRQESMIVNCSQGGERSHVLKGSVKRRIVITISINLLTVPVSAETVLYHFRKRKNHLSPSEGRMAEELQRKDANICF
jgi:hypothetical protein